MDPLAELRDIQLPDPVSWWPPAPGWWLLAALLLALVAYGLWRLARWHRRQGIRRAALARLNSLMQRYEEHGSTEILTSEINILLKTFAVKNYDKEEVARLQGQAWLAFLDQSADSLEFSQGAGQVLASAPYGAAVKLDVPALRHSVADWIGKQPC